MKCLVSRLHLILVSQFLCLDLQAVLVLVLGLVLYLHTLALMQALVLLLLDILLLSKVHL